MGTLGLAPIAGCESLPGNEKQQGAVIGGVGGAVAGAALSKNNRALGALIGGALGAGGGYLIGANMNKIKDKKTDEAVDADKRAKENPAKPSDVENAKTADINDDGFVTLDEVVAMKEAGLSDKEQVRRLERTQQYFELTSEQEKYLEDHGVTHKVVLAMRNMKPDETELAADRSSDAKVDMRTDRNRR
jgi:hypothetical protein